LGIAIDITASAEHIMTDSSRNDPVRISNWNYSGGPLVMGFVAAPVLIVLLVGVFLTGGMKDKSGAADWVTTVLLGSLLIAGSAAMIHYAFTQAVLWVELGEELRYRQVLGERTRPWSDVAAIRFEDEQSRVKTKVPGVAIPLGTHRVLVVTFHDGKHLRIKVTHQHEQRIQAIAVHLGKAGQVLSERSAPRWGAD
jgi:hypothetical protein